MGCQDFSFVGEFVMDWFWRLIAVAAVVAGSASSDDFCVLTFDSIEVLSVTVLFKDVGTS